MGCKRSVQARRESSLHCLFHSRRSSLDVSGGLGQPARRSRAITAVDHCPP